MAPGTVAPTDAERRIDDLDQGRTRIWDQNSPIPFEIAVGDAANSDPYASLPGPRPGDGGAPQPPGLFHQQWDVDNPQAPLIYALEDIQVAQTALVYARYGQVALAPLALPGEALNRLGGLVGLSPDEVTLIIALSMQPEFMVSEAAGAILGRLSIAAASVSATLEQRIAVVQLLALRERFVTAAGRGATFGRAASTDYRATFLAANPELEGQVVVHHAVEQQTLTRFPNVVGEAEIHSLENLRGIPISINSDVHLSQIRRAWNQFYRENPAPTGQQLLQKATEIDATYGSQFLPPR